MKKICFVSQFPPPIHGLSKAVDTLFNSSLGNDFALEAINITNNKKIFQNIRSIRKSNADIFYFTISQSVLGNIRDLIIMREIIKKNKKIVIHLHGGYYRYLMDHKMIKLQKNFNKKLFRKVDAAIVLGNSLKYIFKDIVEDEKIHVVPNCVDTQYLISEEEYAEKIKKIKTSNTKEILYLSNFIESKGYKYVLEMARLEKNRIEKGEQQRFIFNFAGAFFSNKEKDYFEKYIIENNLENIISYYGIVKGNEKYNLLKKSDIFVLLTTYPKEGQPISILEAMGNGMMIVTTNHAGIPDIIDNTNNIMVDTTFNVKEVYNSILNNKNIDSISLENRRSAIENFSEKEYIENCKKVFNKLI